MDQVLAAGSRVEDQLGDPIPPHLAEIFQHSPCQARAQSPAEVAGRCRRAFSLLLQVKPGETGLSAEIKKPVLTPGVEPEDPAPASLVVDILQARAGQRLATLIKHRSQFRCAENHDGS